MYPSRDEQQGLILFQAGLELFCVGAFELCYHSPVFNDMLSLPPSDQDQGRKDTSSIKLSSPLLSAAIFELLLNWLYRVP